MKFTVIRSNFLKGLSIVSKAVNSRSALPILSNVLIRTEKGGIKLIASDLQITISVWIGAKIDKDGEAAVPAKVLMEYVNQVSGDKLDGETEGASLHLRSDKSKATFAGINSADFPDVEISDSSNALQLELDSAEFDKAIRLVGFSTAVDEGRPVLTGIYFKVSENTLTLAGTDGFRMAEYKMKLDKEYDEVKCIVPAKSLLETVKSFSVTSDKIQLSIDSEHNVVGIKASDMQASLRMIEGEYPAYSAVVPSEFTTIMSISAIEFSAGVKLANVFARDTGNMFKISLEGNNIKIYSQPSEAGNNSSELKGEVEGADIEIAFNAKYLLDFFTNVSANEIRFYSTESLKPGLFRVDELENYFYLVMPMKANW